MRIKGILILGVWMMKSSTLSFASEASSVYSPIGKRDPFQIPRLNLRDPASAESDLFRYQVEQFELKAVLKMPNPVRS